MVISGLSFNTTSILTVRFSLPPPPPPPPSSSHLSHPQFSPLLPRKSLNNNKNWLNYHHTHQNILTKKDEIGVRFLCKSSQKFRNSNLPEKDEDNLLSREALQLLLWAAEGFYIIWLFLLPYAPGDPVWAISQETINSLLGLSLNFFFVLPLMNSIGIHLLEAPVLHPMSEGLFNFVIAWTLMFAPLLFTDRKRDRYKGSLDVLWGFQMFLTNTFLIPYMAIRLNEPNPESAPTEPSKFGTVMVNGAPVVGLIGGAVCLLSLIWACFGRTNGDFGTLTDRWEYLISYLGSERLGYAFVWDIVLYMIFQPWLIGDNIDNVEESKIDIVRKLRFIPVFGLFAYLLTLNPAEEL